MAANRWYEDFDDFDDDDEMTFRTDGYASAENLDDLRTLTDAVMLTGRFPMRRDAVSWVMAQEFVHVEEGGLVFTKTQPADVRIGNS